MFEDRQRSFGEREAFERVYAVIGELRRNPDFNSAGIGRGVLVAAWSCLRKDLPSDEVVKLFHSVSDDFAESPAVPAKKRAKSENLLRKRSLIRDFITTQ